jgi:hypothetical protein
LRLLAGAGVPQRRRKHRQSGTLRCGFVGQLGLSGLIQQEKDADAAGLPCWFSDLPLLHNGYTLRAVSLLGGEFRNGVQIRDRSSPRAAPIRRSASISARAPGECKVWFWAAMASPR